MQFTAQHQFYQEHYTETDFLVMLRDAVPVGRLYVARWKDEIRIVDIALLLPYRNAGLGTAILRDILAEAAAEKPVRIHIEQYHPALWALREDRLAPQALGIQANRDKKDLERPYGGMRHLINSLHQTRMCGTLEDERERGARSLDLSALG